MLASQFAHNETDFNPEFKHYDAGDIIIEEGTEGDEVYTLMTGTTKAVSNNIEVGEVNKMKYLVQLRL